MHNGLLMTALLWLAHNRGRLGEIAQIGAGPVNLPVQAE
jgi:hypothetical protein